MQELLETHTLVILLTLQALNSLRSLAPPQLLLPTPLETQRGVSVFISKARAGTWLLDTSVRVFPYGLVSEFVWSDPCQGDGGE